jgi:hypothetical protein
LVLWQAPLSTCLVSIAALGLVMPLAAARGPDSDLRDLHSVRSVFFIAKSENKNQVHYGIRLDETCAPVGDAPVFVYWRMLERGPFETEPLLAREAPAYGFVQTTVLRDRRGGRVMVTLNALPKRPIAIESAPAGAACAATAKTTISGTPAFLTSVYVQLRWPLGVEYIMLWGGAANGLVVHERVAK